MGVLEILIVAVIALIVFGGYFRKRLPEFGRVAGRNARIGGVKAKELADQATVKGSEVSGKVGEKVGDRFDPADMGRSAGKHVREAREFRDSFKSMNPMAEAKAKATPEEKPEPTREAPVAEKPATEPSPEQETPVAAPAAEREAESAGTGEAAGRPKPEAVPPSSDSRD